MRSRATPLGSVAPDGSPVEIYLRLPPRGEAEFVHGAIPDGAAVLELGCGVGRITHELIRLGHPVVAVDESPEMLAHVRGAETVLSRIEDVDLRRRFPCVLLASHFVNTEEPERDLLLRACARHVDDDGIVVIERYDPMWTPEASPARRVGDVSVRLRDVRREGTRFWAVAEYEVDGRSWAQPFSGVVLDDGELSVALRRAGLALTQTLDEHGIWVEARLYSDA
jgi:SAM-dependent methyltransferase